MLLGAPGHTTRNKKLLLGFRVGPVLTPDHIQAMESMGFQRRLRSLNGSIDVIGGAQYEPGHHCHRFGSCRVRRPVMRGRRHSLQWPQTS